MRSIPADLLTKINNRNMTIYNNAHPKMEILASRDDELFTVYTIHNKSAGDIDTTLKRSDATSDPHEAYVIYIENGVAHTLKKDLPYDEMITWEYQFEVGPATGVAIEFNGYWEYDHLAKRHNFVTEEYPWVFWIDPNGIIQAQLWDDVNTRTSISNMATKLVAIRGWRSARSTHQDDQGLIVAFIKTDGKPYYVNYCKQEDGSFLWEVAREVVSLPTPVDNIGIFRTNDYRIGVLAEVAGLIYWTLTARNYSGSSVESELVTGHFGGLIHIEEIDLEYLDISHEDEYISGTTGHNLIGLYDDGDIPAPNTGIQAKLVKPNKLTVKFSGPLAGMIDRIKDGLVITDESQTISYKAIHTDLTSNDTVLVTVEADYNPEHNLLVVYQGIGLIFTWARPCEMIEVLPFSLVAPAFENPEHNEYLTGTFGATTINSIDIFYSSMTLSPEYLTGKFGGLVSLIQTMINTGDV